MDPVEARSIAADAYTFGFPLVLMDLTNRMGRSTPMGTFEHQRRFPKPSEVKEAFPSADMLTSTTWLKLSDEPVVVSVPDTGDRFFMLPMMDAWTDVFASPGTRTTGNAACDYALVPPGWKGILPGDMQRIVAPTSLIWIAGRIFTAGDHDHERVHVLQDQLSITPLGRWGLDPAGDGYEIDLVDGADSSPPLHQLETMSSADFFKRLNQLMRRNPPAVADAAFLAHCATLNIGPGLTFAIHDPDTERAIDEGVAQAQSEMDWLLTSDVDIEHGWTILRGLGAYGIRYLQRAAVAREGVGRNLDADAVYPLATMDNEGKRLDGSHSYILHFDYQDLPPVRGPWSLALYNSRHGFADNPMSRYSIGDRDLLDYNQDGSLDLYIQHDIVNGAEINNWLPAPHDEFSVMLNLYWPKSEILTGTWKPPAIQKIG